MADARLEGIRACVFDAYGTLFDVGAAAKGCRHLLGERTSSLTTIWREKQLQYTWLRTLQGKHADFWQVTGDALDFALETFGIADATLRERLMKLYLKLATFPEVLDVLRRLKAAGLSLALAIFGPLIGWAWPVTRRRHGS